MKICSQCALSNPDGSRFCARCGAAIIYDLDDEAIAYVTPIAAGTVFEGKYQVNEEIGRGGMGVVYRGHDLSLGRHVAIKVLPEHFNTDEEVIQRFKKEARAMASLDHPNVVPVYAIGQFKNFHYFVMKFLDGRTLAELLEAKRASGVGRFSPAEATQVLVQACRGLAHAHSRGLIHRDIKPGNIMLSPDLHATIMDFGIVKEERSAEHLTRTGLVFGTPEYMAPEQAQGHAQPGPTTDLYSLGVVAYEMLSGAPPFEGDTPFSVVVKHIKEPPAPLVERVPGVSRALHEVVLRSLEKEPQLRFSSADQMREALEAASAPPPVVPVDAFVVDQPTPRPHALPVPGVLPPGVPIPPAQLGRPSVIPSPIAAVPTPTPPPPSPPVPAPGAVRVARPAVPVPPRTQAHGGAAPASDAAIVDDRPGHYRSLMTAQATRSPQAKRPAWLPAAIVGVLALLGIIGLAVALAVRETPSP